MKKIVMILLLFVMGGVLALPSLTLAGYKKFSGTYKGSWHSYDMTCPSVYRLSNGKGILKIKVKQKGKYTGTIDFGEGTKYLANGKIKAGKIKLHFPGYAKKYNYNGTIKGKKIEMIGHNDDMLGKKLCPHGWKVKVSLKKR